jgi:PncC family amidohydrolase
MSAAAVEHRAPDSERDTLGAEPQKVSGLPLRDLGVRFAFGFAVSAIAGVVGVVLSEPAGGVLLAFPAILPAALTLIERREGTSRAVSDARGAVAGAIAMIAFAVIVVALGTRSPLGGTLAVAGVAWVVVGLGTYWGGMALARVLHERRYLPEVAVDDLQPLMQRFCERELTLAVAESCTGGSLAGLLTAYPGASQVFRGGIVAYTNPVKRGLLGVDPRDLEREGAISEETAKEMARGVREALQADVGISITGAVGTPAEGKPPGLVYVAISHDGTENVVRVESGSDPERARADAIRAAIKLGAEVR